MNPGLCAIRPGSERGLRCEQFHGLVSPNPFLLHRNDPCASYQVLNVAKQDLHEYVPRLVLQLYISDKLDSLWFVTLRSLLWRSDYLDGSVSCCWRTD